MTATLRIAAVAAALLAAVPVNAGPLAAGAARVSITPAADEFLYSVPREKSFVGVRDDVFARALVLADGRRRVAIVSLEVTTVPRPERLVRAIAAAAGIPAEAVLVMATHTHNVPLVFYHNDEVTNPAQPREMQRIEDAAVEATRAAAAKMRPARIAWARGQAFVNTNNGEEAGRKGWYAPDASSDKSLDVIRVTGTDGKPIAAVVTYASHAEVMFRSVTKDGGYEVTGDLPGVAARLLEAQPAAAPVVLPLAGAEGDQLPLFKSLNPDAELPAADLGAEGWGLLDAQARRLAAAVIDAMATMPPGRSDVTIEARTAVATCPGQRYDVERPSGRVLGAHDTPPVSIPVATLRIGDVALAAIGADLASDIGVTVRQASPVAHTTVATMLGGAVGYVLNDAAFVHPGHGAIGSPVKPGCAVGALSGTVRTLLAGDRP